MGVGWGRKLGAGIEGGGEGNEMESGGGEGAHSRGMGGETE